MILFFAGDIHGRISEFYEKVISLERELGLQADWVLQTGNFGIYPIAEFASREARKNGNLNEFAKLYMDKTPVPRNTLFVSGPHEDHRWMNTKFRNGEMELVPGLNWLVNGFSTTLVDSEDTLKITGLGKVYSPVEYNGKVQKKSVSVNKRLSRYTRSEVERACSQGPVDIVLTHQAPSGENFGYISSESLGLSTILYATRAKLLVHGNYNYSKQYRIKATNTEAISLKNMEILPYEFHNGRFQSLKT